MLVNSTKGKILAKRVAVARSFGRRLKGLLFRKELPPGEALIIEPCKSVHTFFMLFPIDLIFYDDKGRVISVFPALPPFRLTPVIRPARGVVELPAGTITETGTETGDTIRFEDG
ncbi:MAG: DUF192 domain-containing protein [Bacillota bacterium]